MTKTYYLANRDRIRARARVFYAANKGRIKRAQAKYRASHKERSLRSYYRLGGAAYLRERRQAVLEKKAGRPRPTSCEACGGPSNGRMHFDHDHRTGVFRGWLCNGCNLALGYLHDDVRRLERLIEYLRRSTK